MNNTATLAYEKALQAKREELGQTVRGRHTIAIEISAEECEQMTLAAQREMAIAALERDSLLAREVEAALKRLKEGAYGICEQCEGEIGARRLQALPWARNCVRCQERIDAESSRELPPAPRLYSLAA